MTDQKSNVNIKKIIEDILDAHKIKPSHRSVKLDYHGNVRLELIDADLCRRSIKIPTIEFRSKFMLERRISGIIRQLTMFQEKSHAGNANE